MADETHEKFLGYLEASDVGLVRAALWLRAKGAQLELPAQTKAPTRDEWQQHSDRGDIYLRQRVEIKHVSQSFTCRKDWPLRTFIVCSKGSYDRAEPKPWLYVILCKQLTHAGLVLPALSYDRWSVDRREDSRIGQKQDFYLVPLEDVHFVALDQKTCLSRGG